MAGDRWLVKLLARMAIPVLPEYFADLESGEQAYHDLIAAYGNPLIFTQEKTRHFVDEKETEETLAGICLRLKDHLVPYLGNPQFASRYVLNKYGDLQDRQKQSSTSSGG